MNLLTLLKGKILVTVIISVVLVGSATAAIAATPAGQQIVHAKRGGKSESEESIDAKLREKQEQLVQAGKLATLGEFTTGVAHELNNPLNNIGLFIGNALDLIEQVFINLLTNACDAIANAECKLIAIACSRQANSKEPAS